MASDLGARRARGRDSSLRPLRLTAALLFAALLLAAPAGARWDPLPTTKPWQIQFAGKLDLSVRAPVYDIDGESSSARTVRALHKRGRRAVCYFSAGTYEPYRSDSRRFPEAVLGKRLTGFPDERWLDVRRLDLLAPILRRRLDVCARKGFDAADPDNVDGYANDTGFALTAADQLRFNRWVAREAHARGLAVGLKNDAAQVPALVRHFDFAVVEQCFQYRECARYSPFVRRGKPVFGIEYEVPRRRFCARSLRLGFSTVFKRLALGSFRRSCRPGAR